MGRRTALGASALIIGANLPDVDVLAYFNGPAADLEWRRGWTHGVLAIVVLPFVLTGSLLLAHKLRRRRGQWSSPLRIVPRELLFLSFIAVVSHPALDTLNTYGVRWLMPFSGAWFYGDVLFIADPWVWLALLVGLYLSVRRQRARRDNPGTPAGVTLGLVGLYMAVMALAGREAERIVIREMASESPGPVTDAMASPIALNPTARRFVLASERQYQVGSFSWLQAPHVDRAEVRAYPRGRPAHPAVEVAIATPVGRRFLGWARFPTYQVEQVADENFLIHIVDLRYARGPGARFGSVSIPVTLSDTVIPR